MIKRLFAGKINSITMAALLVAFSSLISRFLGIFRDRILASEFGAGSQLDTYYAAFRIPDLIFNLIVLGALSAGFIPVFTTLVKNSKNKENIKKAWELTSVIINILGFSLIILSVAGMIFSKELTGLIAPGFSFEQKMLASRVTRIMFLSPVFLGLSSVFGGVLQSFKRFFVYSLSPIVYNVGIIVGALYLAPSMGVYGLAWGVAMGAFLHMLVQVPMVFKLGYRYKPTFNFRNVNVKKIGALMVPRTMSLAISQLNLLVITIIASTLVSGSLAVFNLANNLQAFPVGIFGISFAIASFPTLSAVAFDKKKLVGNFSNTFRQILFFVMPSTVLLLTLRAQIIRVILGAGHFDWNDTVMTIDALGFFTLSLFAQATIPLLIRVYYARHNSSTPFVIGLISAVLNIVLSYVLSAKMGVAGLALAFSISSIANFILLWLLLHIEVGGLDEFRILFSILKFSLASLALGFAVQVMKKMIWPYIDMTKFLGVFIQGLSAGIIGIIVYIIFCFLLNSEELFNFWEAIKRRLSWKKIDAGITGDQGEARGI